MFLINLPSTSAILYQYHQFITTACDNNQLSNVTLKYMQLTSKLFSSRSYKQGYLICTDTYALGIWV